MEKNLSLQQKLKKRWLGSFISWLCTQIIVSIAIIFIIYWIYDSITSQTSDSLNSIISGSSQNESGSQASDVFKLVIAILLSLLAFTSIICYIVFTILYIIPLFQFSLSKEHLTQNPLLIDIKKRAKNIAILLIISMSLIAFTFVIYWIPFINYNSGAMAMPMLVLNVTAYRLGSKINNELIQLEQRQMIHSSPQRF
ncbi:hypothetical protein [Mycoplasmopsis gallinacea]|uniref:Uncharacterized protein n=1 Tax=Mycoplasmopsis gallinacea TaxID=29556 RepID=A0A6H0V1L5_9BACT|nr:hypothetical protein [Mycoplasmopsis gallinacea]QIW62092.1 hypothetical protein GOQ20_01290 [Mycoplasmopsis gallinacea]